MTRTMQAGIDAAGNPAHQPDDVEQYYLMPRDPDDGRVVRFDHDFIGRAALERMVPGPHRVKVTLVWDKADVLRIFVGMMEDYPAPELMELPSGHYAAHPCDQVLSGGSLVGLSTYPVHSANERAWISLAMVRADLAAEGSRVDILWGERDGGTAKPHVERHRQMTVAATVHPWPIHTATREGYRRQTRAAGLP
ncbi:MAG: hypothetical protein ACK4S2_01610 [Gemmobacter sp.]|uniref:hypothetical protein n=1 Tax=Gemmobacter sp. TaxID=1898957 RepID=UPI0039196F0F